MRHLISLKEQNKQDLLNILNISQEIKAKYKKGELTDYLKDKTLIMLFEKSSTRTRLSFEAGMTQLGGHAIYLDKRTTQITFADFVDEMKAVVRYCDILMYRAMKAENVIRTAGLNKVPVIDACSEKYHPAQTLGDLLTMEEYSNGLKNVKKVVFLGISNNVSNTLKLACSKLGIECVLATPEVDKASVDEELDKMTNSTGLVKTETDLAKALKDADYVYTDAWINMEFFAENGQPKPEFKEEYERRIQVFKPHQLNAQLVDKFCPSAKLMHCMPCHVGYEISRDAIDHKNSVIFDQAENRMHIQKGIIMWLLEKNIS